MTREETYKVILASVEEEESKEIEEKLIDYAPCEGGA